MTVGDVIVTQAVAARVLTAFRRRDGLTGWAHDSNRKRAEQYMFEALEEVLTATPVQNRGEDLALALCNADRELRQHRALRSSDERRDPKYWHALAAAIRNMEARND